MALSRAIGTLDKWFDLCYIHDEIKYPQEWEVVMDVSEYQFNEAEIERLHEHRDNQLDVRLKIRFMAMLMLAEGIELKTIASIVGKSVKTIENWHCQYASKGIDSLNSFQYQPKKSYLTEVQIDQVVIWVKETNPGKTKQVKDYIQRHFQIAYSNEAVRKMLKKRGLKILRPKVVPGSPPSETDQKKTSNAILR